MSLLPIFIAIAAANHSDSHSGLVKS